MDKTQSSLTKVEVIAVLKNGTKDTDETFVKIIINDILCFGIVKDFNNGDICIEDIEKLETNPLGTLIEYLEFDKNYTNVCVCNTKNKRFIDNEYIFYYERGIFVEDENVHVNFGCKRVPEYNKFPIPKEYEFNLETKKGFLYVKKLKNGIVMQ